MPYFSCDELYINFLNCKIWIIMWLSLTQFLDYNEKVSGIDNHWCFSTSPFILSHKSKFSEVWKAMCSLSLRMSGILSNFHLPDSQEIENRPSSYTCCRCLRPWWPAAMLQPRRPHWSTEWPKQARLENLLRSQGPWSKSCCGNIRERDHRNRSIMSWGGGGGGGGGGSAHCWTRFIYIRNGGGG